MGDEKKALQLVACIAVVHDSRLLLLQRGPTAAVDIRHRWCIPGGKVEPNEDSQHAAVREAAEELGIELRPERIALIGVGEYPEVGVKLVTWGAVVGRRFQPRIEAGFQGFGWFTAPQVLQLGESCMPPLGALASLGKFSWIADKASLAGLSDVAAALEKRRQP